MFHYENACRAATMCMVALSENDRTAGEDAADRQNRGHVDISLQGVSEKTLDPW